MSTSLFDTCSFVVIGTTPSFFFAHSTMYNPQKRRIIPIMLPKQKKDNIREQVFYQSLFSFPKETLIYHKTNQVFLFFLYKSSSIVERSIDNGYFSNLEN
jgi:hypothetical protein